MFCCRSKLFGVLSMNITTNANRCIRNIHKSIHNKSYDVSYSNYTKRLLDYGSKFKKSSSECKRGLKTRSPREETKLPDVESKSEFIGIGKPIAFTVMVCGCSFIGAMIYKYEFMRKHAVRIMYGQKDEKPGRNYPKQFGFREHIQGIWSSLTPSKKLVAGIIMSNVLVFVCWRFRNLEPFLTRYFTSAPIKSSALSSMLFSAFSHYSAIHIFANMYVFWSFSTPVTYMFSTEEFAAFYLSAAVFSSLIGHSYKLAIKSSIVSLGASGALLAIIGAVCIQKPDAKLQIALIGEIFPHSFSASSACKAIIAFDVLGVLLRWQIFDHAAHLGGMMFGLWYMTYGHQLIWDNRDAVMKIWHNIRGKP